jgi:predicted CXXCH cytochrome family protein
VLRLIAVAVYFAFTAVPLVAQTPDYVGSKVCGDCHTETHQGWGTSHHAQAWRLPTDEILKDAFLGETFSHDGMEAEFYRDGDAFLIDVTEKDGSQITHTVHSIGGTHPLLHMIIETQPGRLQSFDVTWDVEAKRWFHLYPDQDLPPDDGYHWTGPYKNWNGRCAECHATGFEKNYDIQTRSYSSTQAEMGVGCEACHGPANAHLRRQANQPLGDYAVTLDPYGFTAALTNPQATMAQCASCHSRREAFGNGNPLPGTSFYDSYNLAFLRPGLYSGDGQILDEVYVYGSFRQSKMYEAGVTCVNCHDVHTAKLKAEGNGLCTQCHSPAGNSDFPTLTLMDYDTVAHHNHSDQSTGAQCVNCHMPERTYMGVDPRRDHSMRVPRPDLHAETTAQDACTTCHDGQTPDWAAQNIAKWHPEAANRDASQLLALAAAHGAAQPLPADLGDYSGMVQATLLWLQRESDDLTAKALEPYLQSEDPIVRAGAIGAARYLPTAQGVPILIAGLNDERRNVRVAAARAISQLDRQPTSILSAQTSRRMFAELGQVFGNQMDYPETHLQMGGLALIARNTNAAARAFREVVTLDPQNTPAWVTLIRIAAATQEQDAVEQLLTEALSHLPDDATLLTFQQDLARQ